MPDTIVMEPDTLVVDDGQSTEVEPVVDAPEETAAPDPVETETHESAFEDDASASKDPIVAKLLDAKARDIEARLTQSFKDREANAVTKAQAAQREQSFVEQSNQAAQWRQAEAGKEIYGLLKLAESSLNDGKSVDETWGALFRNVSAMQQRIDQAAITQTFASITPIANEALLEAFPDYSAPPELYEAYFAAMHRYDPRAIFKSLMVIAKDAAYKDKGHEAEVEERIKGRIAGDQKVSVAQAASANRAGRSPTLDIPAGGNSSRWTRARFQAEYDGHDAKWASLPKDERTRIMQEVDQDDLRRSR